MLIKKEKKKRKMKCILEKNWMWKLELKCDSGGLWPKRFNKLIQIQIKFLKIIILLGNWIGQNFFGGHIFKDSKISFRKILKSKIKSGKNDQNENKNFSKPFF
jgi:hypothetical protein